MNKRIPGLDGLRGIAALIVLLDHTSNWGFTLIPSLSFSGIGRSGVILFFVLSAFLLSSQVIAWDKGGIFSKRRWIGYFIARAFRILPLFLIVIVTSYISTNVSSIPAIWKYTNYIESLPVPMNLDSFFKHLMFLKGEDILWTIPVEFKFYFMLPAIFFILALIGNIKSKTNRYIVALASYIFFDWLFLSNTQHGTDTLPFISVFLVGVLLAFLVKHPLTGNFSEKFKKLFEVIAWSCLLIYILLIPSVTSSIFTLPEEWDLSKSNALYSLIWGLMIFSMLNGKGLMARILDSKFPVFLGAVSYSLYLWHRAPMKITHRLEYYNLIDLTPATAFLILTAVSILIAYLSYRTIEIPFLALGQRIRRRYAS